MYSLELNAFVTNGNGSNIKISYRYDIPIYCDYQLDVGTVVNIVKHMKSYLLDNYPDVQVKLPLYGKSEEVGL